MRVGHESTGYAYLSSGNDGSIGPAFLEKFRLLIPIRFKSTELSSSDFVQITLRMYHRLLTFKLARFTRNQASSFHFFLGIRHIQKCIFLHNFREGVLINWGRIDMCCISPISVMLNIFDLIMTFIDFEHEWLLLTGIFIPVNIVKSRSFSTPSCKFSLIPIFKPVSLVFDNCRQNTPSRCKRQFFLNLSIGFVELRPVYQVWLVSCA